MLLPSLGSFFLRANGLELRRRGAPQLLLAQHPYHTTLIANRAVSPVASSEWLFCAALDIKDRAMDFGEFNEFFSMRRHWDPRY